jgi:FkbM family methyltransferase
MKAFRRTSDRTSRPLRYSHAANALRWILNFRGQRTPIGRRYIFDALGIVTPSIAIDTDGLRLFLSTSDGEVSRETFARGAYERALFERVITELRVHESPGEGLTGRGFLDIGAHIGSATCLAMVRYGAASSSLFEPSPDNLGFLKQNVLVNGLDDRVCVHPFALSDTDGELTFELSDTNWGDHRIRPEGPGPASPALLGERTRRTMRVPARRLDGLVEAGALDLAAIGLAWIDVQGHEGHVLAGARTLLASAIPIVCEYWPYALERSDGLNRFNELVAGSRALFVDLGVPGSRAAPTSDIGMLRGRYPELSSTDLLLLPDATRS